MLTRRSEARKAYAQAENDVFSSLLFTIQFPVFRRKITMREGNFLEESGSYRDFDLKLADFSHYFPREQGISPRAVSLRLHTQPAIFAKMQIALSGAKAPDCGA